MTPDSEGPRPPRQGSSTSRSSTPRPSTPRAGAQRRPGTSPSGGTVVGASAEESVTPAKPARTSRPKAEAAGKGTAAAKPATAAAAKKPAAARTPATRKSAAAADAPATTPAKPAGTRTRSTSRTTATATAKPAAPRRSATKPPVEELSVSQPPVEELLVEAPSEERPQALSVRDTSAGLVRTTARRGDGLVAVEARGLTKRYAGRVVVDEVALEIPVGSFFGFVGPNGAGKTTTLAMITGMLRPDAGEVLFHGIDVWRNPSVAKRQLGVLPDRLRLFDRLTGVEFLHHAGALRGLDREDVIARIADLAVSFGIEHSLDRFVADYSAGMVKKIAIAAAMIHSPRVLVLDEPFESVDPVSAATITGILEDYVAAGGTVVLSSHSMEFIERVCDSVAIIVDGRILKSGPMADVVDGSTLERRFVALAGGSAAVQGMEWLQSFSE